MPKRSDRARATSGMASSFGNSWRHYLSGMSRGLPRGTVTFLFTDIEDSARLWAEGPTDMADGLRAHDAIVRGTIERRGGYVFALVTSDGHKTSQPTFFTLLVN